MLSTILIFFLSYAILRKPELVYTVVPSPPEGPFENEKIACFESD